MHPAGGCAPWRTDEGCSPLQGGRWGFVLPRVLGSGLKSGRPRTPHPHLRPFAPVFPEGLAFSPFSLTVGWEVGSPDRPPMHLLKTNQNTGVLYPPGSLVAAEMHSGRLSVPKDSIPKTWGSSRKSGGMDHQASARQEVEWQEVRGDQSNGGSHHA